MAVPVQTSHPPRSNQVRRRALWVASQVAIVLAGVFVYFRVRNLTEGTPHLALAHADDLYGLEQRLGMAWEPALQEWLSPSKTMQTLANWIYIWGHWPVIVAAMVWLVWHHRGTFLRLRDAMLVSGALGMVAFAVYPVMPPRLAGFGLVDTVTEQSYSYRVLQPPGFVNQYAAMPSLHVGWDLLVGIALVSAAGTVLVKAIGFTMPVLMAFAVVATANHYVLDVVAGVAFVLVGHAVALVLERRRQQPVSDAGPD